MLAYYGAALERFDRPRKTLAATATGAAAITRRTFKTLTASSTGGATRFVVADGGIGMAAEEVPRVFEAFYRASNAGGLPGTGLGLAIVKQCVDLHGGTATVESALGKGTRFTIELPARG